MSLSYGRRALTCVSALDKSRLESLIERQFGDGAPLSPAAEKVLQRLRTAELVVQPGDVPRDLVTMNSTVRLVDPIYCERWEVTVVYPEDHDPEDDRWSILSPIGAELYGRRVYDAVNVNREDQPRAGWVIADIAFQPEACEWMSL